MKAERVAEILRERADRIRRFADREYEYGIAGAFEALAMDFDDEAKRDQAESGE